MKKNTLEDIPEPTKFELDKDEKVLEKLKEKWDRLREIANEDFPDIPSEKDFNLHALNIKWLGFRSDWYLALQHMDKKRIQIRRQLLNAYKTSHNLSFSEKELEQDMKGDIRYYNLHLKSERITGIIMYIDGVLDSIKNRYYLIKEYNIRERYLRGQLD